MERIRKIQEIIAKVSLAGAAILLATVCIAIFVNVLCRYIFKVGLMWVEQYARYAIIWSAFLSSNVLIYTKSLMRVDFLDGFLPEGFKQVREMIYTGLFVVILSVLCWQGLLQAEDFVGVTLMGLPVDKFYIYLAIPVGAGLMMLQYLLNLLCAFWSKRKGGQTE